MMVALNLTPSNPPIFILTGVPGLEFAHIWISIPFFMVYMISLLGNFMILFVVVKEQSLHKPMYLLFCMYGLTGIILSTSVVPKVLCIFWFHLNVITAEGCFTQIFFHNAVGAIQGAILVIMAFDRYVAVCDPLRYTTILTTERIALLVFLGFIRSFVLVLPLPFLLWRLPFCANCIIHHTYCEHIALVNMSCGDTTVNRIYSLLVTFLIIGVDLTLIGLSYGLILRAVLSLSSKKDHQKALNTCATHICVMVISYSTFVFSMLTHRFGQSIPAHVHILLANLYLLTPSMLNPIIYGVKTKEIREKIGKYTSRMLSYRHTDIKSV